MECFFSYNKTDLFIELVALWAPDTSVIDKNGTKIGFFFVISFMTSFSGLLTLVPTNCVFAPISLPYYEYDPDNHCT